MRNEKLSPDRPPQRPAGIPGDTGGQAAPGDAARGGWESSRAEPPAVRQKMSAPAAITAAALDKKQVLRARARELAREPHAASPAGRAGRSAEGVVEVVEFLLAGERYAVESTRVREVYPLRELTPLPCTPPFVLGIINLRGQILAVVDLRRFFDLPVRGLTDLNKVLVLESAGVEVGVLADAIAGVRVVPPEDLQPPLPTLTGVRAAYLRGVTGDRLAVLDAGRILADEELIVHEEVEAP